MQRVSAQLFTLQNHSYSDDFFSYMEMWTITRKTNNWDGDQLDITEATKRVCLVEEEKSYTVRNCLLSHLG